MILVLLDLSAAFDTVDHILLLSRLESYVGLKGSVLNWFKSYLSGRYISVRMGNFTSSAASLECGLTQGSTLAPLFSSLFDSEKVWSILPLLCGRYSDLPAVKK